jgi:precorrin-8X/cobalt-precorrin-8 methylmutase
VLFDRYLIVDWSASSKPKGGKDSVWIADLGSDGPPLTRNPRTRREAEAIVRGVLREAVDERHRVLVGFDFPYSYPAGFACALGLDGAAWEAIWKCLAESIEDDDRNVNNRFHVADEINARLPNPVFWGCPNGKVFDHLAPTKDQVIYSLDGEGEGLAEWREVEAILHAHRQHPQATWKLNGNGSVGGQSLTGIPVLARLRSDPALAAVSLVWPFEVAEPNFPDGEAAILHAEIWPSLRDIPAVEGQVKDESQVIFLAEEYRSRDLAGTLGSLFAAASSPAALEEGWILGVE